MPSQMEKTPTEFLKLNVRELNTLRTVKYKYIQSQKKKLPTFYITRLSRRFQLIEGWTKTTLYLFFLFIQLKKK